MRKLSLRPMMALVAIMMLQCCDPYKSEIEFLDGEVSALEEKVDVMNGNLSALSEIMTAMLNNDFVTDVTMNADYDGTSYDITFSKSGKITVLCGRDGLDGRDGRIGKDGRDGQDGKDADTPDITISKDVDGVWYWKVNGSWLYDSRMNKVPVAGADGCVPKLKIEGVYWYISYDKGVTWERVASSVRPGESYLFKSVDCSSFEDYIEFVLTNGEKIQIPKDSPLRLDFSSIDSIEAGGTVILNYYIYGYEGIPEIAVIEPDGWTARVDRTSNDRGTITVTAPDPLVFQSILVFVSCDGRTIMRSIDFSPEAVDLSAAGTANSYVVPEEGIYSFNVSVAGIGERISAGLTDIGSAHILWENDGTKNAEGSLIKELWLVQTGSNYSVKFRTAVPYKKGNALVYVTDYNGKVIWSWHLWFSGYDPDKESCTYAGNAGVQVMDRNLGALTNSPSDAMSSGAMYQWGRKDPFISEWKVKESSSISGSIDYALQNPDTFITSDNDWNPGTSESGWGSEKTDFDPCPPGWKVADISLWSSFPSTASFNNGMTFSGTYSVPFSYYPASGMIDPGSAQRKSSGTFGGVWSADGSGSKAEAFTFSSSGSINKSELLAKAAALPVRCCRNSSTGPSEGHDTDLSSPETANSYIVPAGGTYKFKATVKGISHNPLSGTPVSAEVLWETYGTDENVRPGSVVSAVSYKDGYVHFTMAEPFHEGNAVIAVRDRSGKILWSWHIWADAFNPDHGKKLVGSEYVMDRNLGALDATPGTVQSLGLLYQPGRKDPFPASSDILSNVRAVSTGSFDEVDNYDSGQPDIYTQSYTASHPTSYVRDSRNTRPADYLGWDTFKNENDPCPPGWKVADFYFGNHSPEWNRLNRGSTICGLWFPAAGSYERYVGIRGEYFFVNQDRNATDYRFDYSSMYAGSATDWYSTSYPEARSVRCVEDKLSKELDYQTVTRLDSKASANSYIVSSPGAYSFRADRRGNSDRGLGGTPYAAKVLWETDNTSTAVKTGSVIKSVVFYNNTICIITPDILKQGNALVAVTDRNGEILWSWHIWVADFDPEASAVKNVSKDGYPLMDRNLGALSSSAGNDLSAGLLYQWGRKDPFAGSASLSNDVEMAFTNKTGIKASDSDFGNPERMYRYPTTFLLPSSLEGDWQYSFHDSSLWSSSKTQYDPCPPGWRVADGGPMGIWGGFPSSSSGMWNQSQHGMRTDSKYTVPFSWYPASGSLNVNGALQDSGKSGSIWSCSNDGEAHLLEYDSGRISAASSAPFAEGHSVRCCKDYGKADAPALNLYFLEREYSAYAGDHFRVSYRLFPENSTLSGQDVWSSTNPSVASVSNTGIVTAISEGSTTISVRAGSFSASFVCNVKKSGNVRDLSISGSANCYIAATGKSYSFKAVKGNSSEKISGIASVDVLWESYMNNVSPTKGSVISKVSFDSGDILFSTGSKLGNAVIAARSSSGEILWSWHIWVPDNDPTKSPSHFVNYPVDILDRNLGAVTSTPGDMLANGLFYQWGRKDPFVGAVDKSGEKVKTEPADIMKSVNNNSQSGTVEYSIKHPNEVIDNYNNHWVRNSDNSLWRKRKTVYDPCPPGWRVPEYEDGGFMNSFWGSGRFFDMDKHGLYLSTDCILPEMWFPAAGQMQSSGYIYDYQDRAYLWTSSTESNSATHFVSHNPSWGRGGTSRSYGFSVRCVSE